MGGGTSKKKRATQASKNGTSTHLLFGFQDAKHLPHLGPVRLRFPIEPLGHGTTAKVRVFRGFRELDLSSPAPARRGSDAAGSGNTGGSGAPSDGGGSGGGGGGGDPPASEDGDAAANRHHHQRRRKSMVATDEIRDVAIKCQRLDCEDVGRLNNEAVFYEQCSHSIRPHVTPRFVAFGRSEGYMLLALELLGPSLGDVLDLCTDGSHMRAHAFSLPSVCLIAHELLRSFEGLHGAGWVHGDVRLANVLMSTDPTSTRLYLAGLGSGRRIFEPGTTRHVPMGVSPVNVALLTSPYAPLAAYEGRSLSRRDDLESLGYLLVRLAQGTLPWISATVHNDLELMPALSSAQGKLARQRKLAASDDDLCAELPPQFAAYFETVRNLDFHTPPPYDELRALFDECVRDDGGDGGGDGGGGGGGGGGGVAAVEPDWAKIVGRRRRS
jgi:uncharacterized membrane protein YgcG